MLVSSPALLLVLALLVGATATAQPRIAPCVAGIRRIDLKAEPIEALPELCIGAGLSTTLVFYGAELLPQGVTVEGRDKFEWVDAGSTVLKLTLSERGVPAERFKLTVRFKGEAAPASASFWLVVHPGQAEPLVEVYREARTVAVCQQEVKEREAQLRQCQEGHARLKAEQTLPVGLAGLLASRLMGSEGISSRFLFGNITLSSTTPSEVLSAFSYRATRTVAVTAEFKLLEGAAPWTTAGAKLVGPGRRRLNVVRLWQEPPSSVSGVSRIVVEAEATEAQAQGSFTLTVWEAEGGRSISLAGVTFP